MNLKTKFPIDNMAEGCRLTRDFFLRDVLEVAPGLIGKDLVIKDSGSMLKRLCITEVEAYRGEEDKACHASRGRTSRTETMYHEGGRLYIYLIYGMYWMLNIVSSPAGIPQAVLIRGAGEYSGPGRLTRSLGIDRSFNDEDLVISERIWVEDAGRNPGFVTSERIGVEYAGEFWKSLPWRYCIAKG